MCQTKQEYYNEFDQTDEYHIAFRHDRFIREIQKQLDEKNDKLTSLEGVAISRLFYFMYTHLKLSDKGILIEKSLDEEMDEEDNLEDEVVLSRAIEKLKKTDFCIVRTVYSNYTNYYHLKGWEDIIRNHFGRSWRDFSVRFLSGNRAFGHFKYKVKLKNNSEVFSSVPWPEQNEKMKEVGWFHRRKEIEKEEEGKKKEEEEKRNKKYSYYIDEEFDEFVKMQIALPSNERMRMDELAKYFRVNEKSLRDKMKKHGLKWKKPTTYRRKK